MERARRSPEPIIRMVAHSRHHGRLVADLHERAVSVGHASRSVLLELDGTRQHLRPTSGTNLDPLPAGPWMELPDSMALAFELFASGHPRQVAPLATVLPDLACRLESPAAILAPVISQGRGLGLLVLAVSAVVPALEWMDDVAACADGFALALTRARFEHDAARQREADALVLELSRSGAGGPDATHLERLCRGLARVFDAERVALWRHDRVARHVSVAAASDGSHRRRQSTAPTGDESGLLVKALRGSAVELMAAPAGRTSVVNAVVPLRGQRRALGVLVFQGLRLAPGDDPGLPECLTTLGHGVSAAIEGRQLLEGIQAASRELENTFDSMGDLVAAFDRRLRLVRLNRAGAERLGLPRESLVGRPASALLGQRIGAWLESVPLDGSTGSVAHAAELEEPALGGTFRLTATPLSDTAGAATGLVVIAHDVTEERRAESERTSLRERLARSEAMTQLVAGIAHELNNPLQAVLGHLELTRRGGQVTAPVDRALRLVYREAARAARIVRNLLLLAGEGRLTLRAVSANRALTRALGLRAADCRRQGLTVRRDLGEGLPPVRGGAVLLQQAFLNILVNAEQAIASTAGGRIEVRSFRRRNRVVIQFHDNGPGLPAEVVSRVFEPFFTTRAGGSGLGLALTQRIIHEFGGEVTADNHKSGGAVFTVSLPMTT